MKESVTEKVQEFYASLPFNFHGDLGLALQTIREENAIAVYPNLEAILSAAPSDAKILDVGCGAGWFAHSLAYRYGLPVTGIDLCEEALERARNVSRALGVADKTAFQRLDLFETATLQNKFFLVNSLGVLHHTFDCRLALEGIAGQVQDHGYLHLGLYSKYGREPFLNLFRPFREANSEESEQKAFALYKELNRHIADERFLFSWFRDQVLHPHESQHTLEEVYAWLTELGFECLSTSINRFRPVSDWEELFEEEKKMFDLSTERNCVEKVYFPGFFTILARKK